MGRVMINKGHCACCVYKRDRHDTRFAPNRMIYAPHAAPWTPFLPPKVQSLLYFKIFVSSMTFQVINNL